MRGAALSNWRQATPASGVARNQWGATRQCLCARLRPRSPAALALGLAAGPAVLAETPADTLVIADKIDDIVSLDPAESFEFSGNDLLNNVYDTLIELDPADLGPLVPGLAESWEVAEDGMTYTFKMRAEARSSTPATR